MDKKYVCCICDKEFEGFGNNPYPISEDPNDRCCDKCNMEIVFPRRLLNILEEENEDK